MVAASALRTMWCEGKKGKMCPKEQAKAWALREAWRELHGESTYGMCKWIAARVFTVGNPPKHPSIAAVQQFLDKVIEDPEWHPGKMYGKPAGRPCNARNMACGHAAVSLMCARTQGIWPAVTLRSRGSLRNARISGAVTLTLFGALKLYKQLGVESRWGSSCTVVAAL